MDIQPNGAGFTPEIEDVPNNLYEEEEDYLDEESVINKIIDSVLTEEEN